jgi:hypothetical protein
MSEESLSAVDCPVCETTFDPIAAGGWCTNPECGEWRYERATDGSGSDSDVADEASSDDSGSDASAVVEEMFKSSSHDPGPDPEPPVDEEPRAENRASKQDAGEELSAATVDCPACGEGVAPGDSFCASCGTSLAQSESRAECPSCGAAVEPADSYCSGCGEHLDPHRSGGASASASAGATESAAGLTQEAPAALSLKTRGRELTVSDGDTVGRRVRRIVSDTSDDEAAVRVHREHVRFIRENGQFHVVDLGDNPTRVNEYQLTKGDRRPIGPGDELGLSGVVTLSVDRP